MENVIKKSGFVGLFFWGVLSVCSRGYCAAQIELDKTQDVSTSGELKDNQQKPVEEKKVVDSNDASASPDKKNASDNKSQSPYSYKPTEQISEDLSVAFPVDI